MSWASDLLVDARDDEATAARARAAFAGAAHVLVDNDAVGVAAVAFGADPAAVSNVPWGVDLAAFPAAPTRPQDGPLRLISLRTFEPVYDVATLVRAVALTSGDVTLTLAGSGSLEPDLHDLADDLGISVSWAGRVPEPDVPALLAAHDVHVSTSTSDGTSISLLQAMATARPSIVTDIPSNRTWVPDDWRFPTGDAAALAARIDAVDRGGLAAAGAAARALAEERADWDRNRRRIIDLYDRLDTQC
jgi:glycosyltransferase involved in cell wall biosynthesis